MRNLKRFLAMTLTMLMVVGCFSFASFAKAFDDVYDYADAIDVLSDLGVIWGYEDGTFGPDDTVQRWHMALWIAKMETGKVSSDDYVAIWKADTNYTNFTDVTVDQAVGAINYASDEGIIIGRSASIFDPTAGITYQDALTMVVRALGFGGSAMDAGYPWKYINKASQLGLEKGLSGIAYTDVLTRAETAQILANALYVQDSAGKTYVSDVFGLATVVITGTNNFKMNSSDTVEKTGYVSFNLLNSDGTINNNVTYHLPSTAFEIDAADVDKYVGASFRVTTADNFQSLGVVIENPAKIFDAADIVGQGTPADPNGTTVKLGEDTYKAVKGYTSLYNAQGNKVNTAEILVYKTTDVEPSSTGYFTADANGNLLDKDGKVVVYYVPAMTGSYAEPYMVKTNNAYTFVAISELKLGAHGAIWNSTYSNAYAITTNTYDLVKNNKHATAVAYDDNNDGVYDRLFYTYQSIANISLNGDTTGIANDYYLDQKTVKPSVVVTKFIDGATGDVLTTAPTGYIRYSYNPLSKYLTVYQTYTYGTGLVTAVNTSAGTTVIGGTQYSVGISTYPGAVYNTVPANDQTGLSTALVGKQVNFILDDGKVVKIFDSANSATYIVFDNITGLTSQGYATALVYAQSTTASIITIASIDGYSYQTYLLLAQQGSLQNITDTLYTGELFQGTKDALGFWHLTTVSEYTYLAFNGHFDYDGDQDMRDPDAIVSFKNGIASTNDRFYYDGKNYGALKSFTQFNTSADTIYIVYNENKDKFYTAKGMPVNGAKILVDEAMFVAYSSDTTKGTTASFIYVYDGSLEGQYTTSAWTAYEYDTVIYVDNNSLATATVTNDLGNGTLLGYTWQYGRVLDMVNGKFITVQTTYNFKLQAGRFYTVSNGYVEDVLEPFTADSDIKEGLLKDFGTFYSVIESFNDGMNVESSAFTYLFALDANGNVSVDADGNLINYTSKWTAASLGYQPVYYYAGENQGSRVILSLSESNVTTYATAAAPYAAYKFDGVKTFTALTATERSDSNYYIVPESLYLALTAQNSRDKFKWETDNVNTYDAWMRLYNASGVEVENWEAAFTVLTDYVTIGSTIAKAPTYAMAIKKSANNVYAELPIGTYTMYFKYNNNVYRVFIKVQLSDTPTILSGMSALIYDVDLFTNDTPYGVLGQNGTMDTGRIYLKTNSNFTANYQNEFKLEVYAIPFDIIHWDTLHGAFATPAALVLASGLVNVYESDFYFDVNGEAVVDMVGKLNQPRDFECMFPTCPYTETLNFNDYFYALKVTSYATGETMFISEYSFTEGFAGQKVVFAPSFDVKVNVTADATATVKLVLDEAWAGFNFAQANTIMTLDNQFKFGGWGDGIAYNMTIAAATPAAQTVPANIGYTWTISPNSGTFDSSWIFNQDPEFLKNLGFTWNGVAYHSFRGTYTYPTFLFDYVLPFEAVDNRVGNVIIDG